MLLEATPKPQTALVGDGYEIYRRAGLQFATALTPVILCWKEVEHYTTVMNFARQPATPQAFTLPVHTAAGGNN